MESDEKRNRRNSQVYTRSIPSSTIRPLTSYFICCCNPLKFNCLKKRYALAILACIGFMILNAQEETSWIVLKNRLIRNSEQNYSSEERVCEESQFKCSSVNTYCISDTWLCNGNKDCADGSDEDPIMCEMRNCTELHFKCTSGQCILNRLLCDGDDDCTDGSDEEANMCKIEDYFDFDVNSFYHGLIISVLPGGILAYIYPAHNVFGISITLSSVFYLFVILSVRTMHISYSTLNVVRLFEGLTMGMIGPACNGIWKLWAPQNERPILATIVLLKTFSKYFKGHPYNITYANNWNYLDYLSGVMGLIWSAIWFYLIFRKSFLSLHCNPSAGELNIMQSSYGTANVSINNNTLFNIPWKNIFTSMPMYAIIVSNICDGWSIAFRYILETIYIKKYIIGGEKDIKSVFDKLFTILLFFGAILSDRCRRTTLLSTTTIRKILSCSCFSIEAICLLMLFRDLNLYWNSFFMLFYLSSSVIRYFGFGVNHMDIASKYGSVLTGITGITLYISMDLFFYSMLQMLQHEILNERELLILVAAVQIIGAIFYGIFASGEVQPWAELQINENRQVIETINIQGITSV